MVGKAPPGTPEGITLVTKAETLLKPSSAGSRDQGSTGEIETKQAKSRPRTRQVTDKSRVACLEMTRNGWERTPPYPAQSCNLGQRPTLDDFNSALRSLRTACSRFPRGIDSPPVAPLRILTPENDPIGRGQVREHRAARVSNRETRSRPRGWPVEVGRGAEKTSPAGRQGGPRLPPPTCRQSTTGWRCRRPPTCGMLGWGGYTARGAC